MKKLALKLGVTATAFMPSLAFAQEKVPTGVLETGDDLRGLLEEVQNWFFTIFTILAVIFLIWAAFLYLTAAGDEEKVKKAKNALIYSVVAIAVALLAGSLPSLIANILGA